MLYHLVKTAAGANSTLSCLQYLVEERGAGLSVLLNAEVFGAAFVKGYVANVQYLLEMGCECKPYVYIRHPMESTFSFTDADFLRCIELAVDHGWQPNESLYSFVVYRSTREVPKPGHKLPLCLAYLNARI
eukprot:gene10141-11879_t